MALDTPRELKLRLGERTATVLLRDRSEHEIRLDDGGDAARLEAWMAPARYSPCTPTRAPSKTSS